MERALITIAYIAFGMSIGMILRFRDSRRGIYIGATPKYIELIRTIALIGLNPFVMISAIWGQDFHNIRFILLPILGFIDLISGGIWGMIFSKFLKHDAKKRGAMYTTCSFSNLGSFGTLASFAFFGESGYAIAALYRMTEDIYYYVFGYPIAKLIGQADSKTDQKSNLLRAIKDKYVVTYLIALTIALTLNFSGLKRPPSLGSIFGALVPLITVLLMIPTGYNIRAEKVKGYLKEILCTETIKLLLIPMVVLGLALLFGMQKLQNGLVFKVLIIMSTMPPALNSLIPPQIYGLDKDLANSCWIVGNIVFLVQITILALVL